MSDCAQRLLSRRSYGIFLDSDGNRAGGADSQAAIRCMNWCRPACSYFGLRAR